MTKDAKQEARAAVAVAMQRGTLKPGPCEVGGDCRGSVQAHHDDYAKPLEVRWLCRRHHQRLHHPDPPPIMLRANIGRDEWMHIRRQALTERRPAADLVADALRAAYPLTPAKGKR